MHTRILALAVVASVVLSVEARPAAAAIVKVQAGSTVVKSNVTSIAPALSANTTAGNLIVAIISTAANATVTAPAGWLRANGIYQTGDGATQIWYDPNNAGGFKNVTFTLSPSTNALAELSEWSGIALSSPLDGSSSGAAATNTTSFTVSATAAAPNELAITSFTISPGTSFTVGTGWTHLFTAASSSEADYFIGAGSGSVSETATSTSSLWAGAIATFFGSCGGGSLSLAAPASATFPGLTLNGTNQNTTTNVSFTVTDSTGNGAGWNLTGTSTTLTNASAKTLPTTATTITAGSTAAAAGTCRLPTNAIGYPVTLPAAATPPTAVKLYNSAPGTGLGAGTLTLTFNVAVPANAYLGTYTSTWTIALVSGP